MKTILIPTDFSLISKNALKIGASLLQTTGLEGRILLLNTYLLPCSSFHQLVSLHDKLKRESMRKLEKQINWIKKSIVLNQITFEVLSSIGSLENVIAHLIDERKMDYVIIGIDENVDERIVKILKRLRCPALVVPYPSS